MIMTSYGRKGPYLLWTGGPIRPATGSPAGTNRGDQWIATSPPRSRIVVVRSSRVADRPPPPPPFGWRTGDDACHLPAADAHHGGREPRERRTCGRRSGQRVRAGAAGRGRVIVTGQNDHADGDARDSEEREDRRED